MSVTIKATTPYIEQEVADIMERINGISSTITAIQTNLNNFSSIATNNRHFIQNQEQNTQYPESDNIIGAVCFLYKNN